MISRKSVLRTQMFLLTPSICHCILQSPSHPFRRQLSISAFQSDKSLGSISVLSSLTGAAAAPQSLWSLLCCLSLTAAPRTPPCCSANPTTGLPLGCLPGACSKQQMQDCCTCLPARASGLYNSSLTGSMSWTHFPRRNGISNKRFSAFWKKFSSLRTDAGWNDNVSCSMFTIPVPEEGGFPRSINPSLTAVVQREAPGPASCSHHVLRSSTYIPSLPSERK